MAPIRFDHVSELEKLLENVEAFRESRNFFERLVFVKQSRYLAPYNAFLVTQQKKNATFVLSEDKWKRMGRFPKQGANPIVIMIPFGPVEFVYDIEDTEGKPFGDYDPNVPIPSLMKALFPWEGDFTPMKNMYETLCFNGRLAGLFLETRPLDPGHAGQAFFIERGDTGNKKMLSSFHITVNSNHPEEVRLPTLVHELAHIFCGHLDKKAFKRMNESEMEFEAEAVAYLFCYRKGFRPKSEYYLVDYLHRGWSPPIGMFDNILKALRKIDKLSQISHDIIPETCKRLIFYFRSAKGPSYSIESNDCKSLVYTYRPGNDKNPLQEKLTPDNKQWASFWKTCGSIGVGT